MLAILSIKYEYEKTIFPLKIKLFFIGLTVVEIPVKLTTLNRSKLTT